MNTKVAKGSKEAFNLLRESAHDGTLVLCLCRDRATGRELLIVAKAERQTAGQRTMSFIPLASILEETILGPSKELFDLYECLSVMEFV